MRAFAEIGIELFLFKFVPSVAAVDEIRDEVIAPLRAAADAGRVNASAG